MSYEQVSKDLEKVIGYIHSDELTDDEKKLMTEQTLDYFDNYVSPGWLKYRKSVSTNSAVLEWKDHDGVCDGLYGEEFIDCLGGFGIYTCGHRNPEILDTVKAQLDHQALHSQELLDPLRGYLAKAVADITPGDLQYCFFTNGGAEAVEMALKLARIATGGRWYISTVGAFHGKSMGAISMGGKDTYRVPYTPMVQQVQHVEYGNAEDMRKAIINLQAVGEKVAAIANKVQTTRNAIKGIVNRENSQIVFTDTPGIHKPKHKLNQTMVETSFATIPDSDLILFLIEATSDEIGKGDRIILEKIKESKRKTILIINKIDLVKREKLLNLIDLYSKEYNFEAVIPISAYQPKYKEIILDEIEKNLKPGPAYYDVEEYTDQTMRQLAEETIREKALKLLQDEVPHGIYVEVEKMTMRKNKNGEDIYDIEATIYCLKESHKGIIIGKNGEMLKRIGRAARIDMEQNFGLKVNLKTWVKVKQDWIDNESIVANKFKLK